ncbi:MAG: PorP/SprF family type IX secretion system membrane protein [Chitinophagia bacterium]|jgi:type IX secretion system PorP/SprF family membrane protein
MRSRFTILILSLSLSVFFSLNLRGQDLHFSQFYEAPLLRNPALAGLYEGDVRVQGVYRNQWNSVSYPFQTGSINAEYKFKVGRGEDFLTLGGQVLYDKAGTVQLKTVHMLPVVNFHKSLSKDRISYLSLGFMGGIVNRNMDRSRVTTNSQYDGFYFNGALPDGENFLGSYSYADMSVGMSYNTSLGSDDQHLIFGGIAYHHFNKPLNSFYKNITHLPKWVISGGVKINIDEITYVTFHGDLAQQLPFKELIFGGLYSRRLGSEDPQGLVVHAGTYYRYQDAIIPVMKLEASRLGLGLSYDINISKLAGASLNRGGFELSMSWFMNRPLNADIILCPKF